jgi:hypothetical protein
LWTELLENEKALGMFTSEPSLDGVVLSRLVLDREGPTVTMMVQMRDYPAFPPPKWRLEEHNAVLIELQAMAVNHVVAHGWTSENRVSISIERIADGNLQIRAFGEALEIELRCGWLRVAGVTPYRIAA